MSAAGDLPYAPPANVVSMADHRRAAESRDTANASSRRRRADRVAEIVATTVVVITFIAVMIAAMTDWDRIVDVVRAVQ